MSDSASSIPVVKLSDETEVPQDVFDYVKHWLRRLESEQPDEFEALVLCSYAWMYKLKPAGSTRRSLVAYQLADAQTGEIIDSVGRVVRHLVELKVNTAFKSDLPPKLSIPPHPAIAIIKANGIKRS